jgi:hypothetical protein
VTAQPRAPARAKLHERLVSNGKGNGDDDNNGNDDDNGPTHTFDHVCDGWFDQN